MELKYEINCYTAIEGLEDAVIGTASVSADEKEVLAYDFEKAVQILAAKNWTKEEVEAWLEHITDNFVPENQPIFVYRDDNVRKQLKEQRKGGTKLH
jgi:hypothetical protein